jgi:hypothetical protein
VSSRRECAPDGDGVMHLIISFAGSGDARQHCRMADDATTDWTALANVLARAVVNGVYGWTVKEVFGTTLALEKTVDAVLTRALGSAEGWAAAILVHEVMPHVRLDDRLRVLGKVLTHEGVEGAEQVLQDLHRLVDLRHDLAHTSLEAIESSGDLRLVGHRSGKSREREFDPEEVMSIVDKGKEALAVLLPYATDPLVVTDADRLQG